MSNNNTETPKKWTNLDTLPTSLSSNNLVKVNVKEGVYDLSENRIDKQGVELINYFTKLSKDVIRAKAVVEKLTIELSATELEELLKHLQTIKFKPKTPAGYDEVTTEVVTKLEEFIAFIKAKNLDSVASLEDSNIELFQELREAFTKGKILKNELRHYFEVLYGVKLRAKTILTKLRIIEPKLFSDENLKNKKKAVAAYLLSS